VSTRSARALTGAVAAAGLALGILAWLAFASREPAAPEIRGYVLTMPRELPPVELVDEHGAQFGPGAFAGHWSFLYFGYTYCPDVCPLTLVELAKLKQALAASGLAERTEYYLVSVDPKRDTPARLREYVAYFDAELHGLTGSAQALAALAQATETVFDVPVAPADDNYLVSHSSNIVLLDPKGRVHAIFTPPHEPSALAVDFTTVAGRYNGSR
jgi:protein SCO1/2